MPGSSKDYTGALQVHGMKEINAELKAQTIPQMRTELRKANRHAAETIVAAAEAIASEVGPQAKTAAEALSIAATYKGASIKLTEDAEHPFALGAEFGAKHDAERTVGVKKTLISTGATKRQPKKGNRYATDFTNSRQMLGWNQFKTWRGNQWEASEDGEDVGYFLHPAVRDTRDVVLEEYAQTVSGVLDRTVFVD